MPNGDDLEGNQVSDVGSDQGIDGIFESWGGENAEVEKENGNLDGGECGEIDQFVPVEQLFTSEKRELEQG